MEQIIKPNDMFAAVLTTPNVTLFDLAHSNIAPENTQLLSKDFYKNSSIVKESFTGEDGKFNELAFENAYNQAMNLYSDLGSDIQMAKALEWDPMDFTAPLGSRKIDVNPIYTKDFNPEKNLYSRSYLNSIDQGNLTKRELAQAGKIYDQKTGEWSKVSANDLGFFNKFFGDTLVYATYDKDTEEFNPLTGRTVLRKAGEWKTDDDGNYFLEKLGEREIYNKQIVNPMDLLTTDGSAFNKVDFFDSDSKTKSTIGTTAKLLVEIAPFFIPGVNTIYGKYKMAMGLSYVLPTFYKAIEGLFLNDVSAGNETALWKTLNKTQGYLAKFNQNSVSDEASAFGYEQLGSLVTDVFSQIYEQRAAASLSTYFYKNKDQAYVKKLSELAEKELRAVSVYDELTRTAERSKDLYKRIGEAAGAQISELTSLDKKRSSLAKALNLSYMAMTQSADVYGDALAGGYDRRTAGAAALIAASGQYALMMNNRMGNWFLDKTTGYDTSNMEMRRAVRRFINKEMPEIKEGIDKLGTNTSAGRNIIGGAFKKVKNFIQDSGTDETLAQSLKRNAIIEGVEEVSEQAVIDATKGIVDFLSYAGFTGNDNASFGGFDVVFSKQGLENYLVNFVGGAIGGGLFELERSAITPMIANKGKIPKPVQKEVEDYILNGKTKELLELAKEESKRFGATSLSPLSKDVNGNQIFLGLDPKNPISQADIIYSGVSQYVKLVSEFISSETKPLNDEELIRKAIVSEMKLQDLKEKGTDKFILSDYKKYISELVDIKAKIEIAEKNNENTSELVSELKEVKTKIDELQSGNLEGYYVGLSNWTVNSFLNKPFISLNIEDYVNNVYKKDYVTLDSAEKDRLKAEFKAVMEEDVFFKDRMKAMYQEYLKYSEKFSPSMQDYFSTGYNKTRSQFFDYALKNYDVVEQAIEEGDIKTLLGVWSRVQIFNEAAFKSENMGTGAVPAINLNLAKILLSSGLIQIEKSPEELMQLLGVSELSELQPTIDLQRVLSNVVNVLGEIPNMTLWEVFIKSSPVERGYIKRAFFKEDVTQEEMYNVLSEINFADLYIPNFDEKVDLNNLPAEEQEDIFFRLNTLFPNLEGVDSIDLLGFIKDLNLSNINHIAQVASEIKPFDGVNPLTEEEVQKNRSKEEELDKLLKRRFLNVSGKVKAWNTPYIAEKYMEQYIKPVIDGYNAFLAKKGKGVVTAKDYDELIQILSDLDKFNDEDLKLLKKELLEAISEINNLGEKLQSYPFKQLTNAIVNNINAKTSTDPEINKKTKKFEEIINDFSAGLFDIKYEGSQEALEKESMSLENQVSIVDLKNKKVSGESYFPFIDLLLEYAEDAASKNELIDKEVVLQLEEELKKLELLLYTPEVEERRERIKKLKKYLNTKNNTFLDMLRSFEVDLFSENKESIFKLLSELDSNIRKYNSPVEFKISKSLRDGIERGLQVLDMVEAVAYGMLATDFTGDLTKITDLKEYQQSLYGHNVNMNIYYKNKGIGTQLGILSSEELQLLKKEIEQLRARLLHYSLLGKNNAGTLIAEQEKIQNSMIKAMLKKISTTDVHDPLRLLALNIKGRFLISIDDIEEVKGLKEELQLILLENKIRNNFYSIISAESLEVSEALDILFEPFKRPKEQVPILFDKDTALVETMSDLTNKDWYFLLHGILASDSTEFYKTYNKYVEKELTSTNNRKRAPFYTQMFLLRQAYGYFTKQGKEIIAHTVKFIIPNIEESLDKTIDYDSEGNIKNVTKLLDSMKSIRGLNLENLFFMRGTGGTGKSDVLANFLVWLTTEHKNSSNKLILGDTVEIIAVAPTEKTAKILSKSIIRGLTTTPKIDSDLNSFLTDLLAGTSYQQVMAKLKELKKDFTGEIKITDPVSNSEIGTGVYITQGVPYISEKTLKTWLSQLNSVISGNVINKFVILDEASKVNLMEYQILNYLVEHHNYHVVTVGDDLQEPAPIGEVITSGLENAIIPTSIKLKSTIRADNVHKNITNMAMDSWTEGVVNNVFFKGPKPSKPIIPHTIDKGKLFGDIVVSTISVEDLKKLDFSKEIHFITESGKLSSQEEALIKSALGDDILSKSNVTIGGSDVQGQEFDQVVILSFKKESGLSGGLEEVAHAKQLNTLLSRAKLATILVDSEFKDKVIQEYKEYNDSKELQTLEVENYIKKRLEELKELEKSFPEISETPEVTTKTIEEEILENVSGVEEEEVAEVVKLMEETLDAGEVLDSFQNTPESNDSEETIDKAEEGIKDSPQEQTIIKPQDSIVISYTNNIFLKKGESKNIPQRNAIISAIYTLLGKENSSKKITVEGTTYDLSSARIIFAEKNEVESLDDQFIIQEPQYLIQLKVGTNWITIGTLAQKSTIISKNLGNIKELLAIYSKIENAGKNGLSIDLSKNLKIYSGINSHDTGTYFATEKNLKSKSSGIIDVEYKAFRGPYYDGTVEEKLDDSSIEEFIKFLQEELNKYNTTPITVVNGATIGRKLEKGEVDYRWYQYRPYAIITFVNNNQKFKKLVLLHPSSHTLEEVVNNFQSANSEEEKKEALLGISNFRAWMVVNQFSVSLNDKAKRTLYNVLLKEIVHRKNFDQNWVIIAEWFKIINSKKPNQEIMRMLQVLSKGLPVNLTGSRHTFNPLKVIIEGLQNSTIEEEKDLWVGFLKHIEGRKTEEVWYDTRIISPKDKDEPYSGDFDSEHAKHYIIHKKYSTPSFLLDLQGVEEVQSSTTKKTKQKQEEALNTNEVEESLTISFKLVDSSGNVISYPEINDLGEVINNVDTHSITFKLSSNLLGILRKSKTPSEDIRKIKSMIAKEIKEIVEKNKEYLIHEKDYKVEAFTVIDTVVTGLESTFRNINNMSYSEVENLKNSVSLEDLDNLSCKL